ncbi:MAG: hypothetical protein WD512_00595 [Candidatus Paceibacterota bacterium]
MAKEKLYDGMTASEIDMIVDLADEDGAHSLLEDEGKFEAAQYVEDKYWN